jgi:hypothetical protein
MASRTNIHRHCGSDPFKQRRTCAFVEGMNINRLPEVNFGDLSKGAQANDGLTGTSEGHVHVLVGRIAPPCVPGPFAARSRKKA